MITYDDIGKITTETAQEYSEHGTKILYKYKYNHCYNGKDYLCIVGSRNPLGITIVKNRFVKSINDRINGVI